ncbi:putative Transmembrane protein, partial [Quillaja saponaria]
PNTFFITNPKSSFPKTHQENFQITEAKQRRKKERKKWEIAGHWVILIGLPFALVALVLSLVGAVIWVIGTVLSCLCPCCICCAGLANLAGSLIKLPVKVLRWFIDQIPC